MRIRWSFAQMCCAMSLICPSIATHRTCQFWAGNEPVNMPKTIVSRQMWSACAVIRFLYSHQVTRNVVLYDNVRPRTAAATKRLLKRFRWEVFDHPPSSARTWLPVIFISFLYETVVGQHFGTNELQTSVENWLKAQAAWLLWRGIGKLVPLYEKYLRRSIDYVVR